MVGIIVDTELMEKLASKAQIANDGVTEALELLNRVSLHYDWECKEKKAINEYTVNNKNKINKLHEKTDRYLRAVADSATEYVKTEFDICNSFNDLDIAIGKGVAGIGSVIEKNINICPIFIDLKEVIKSDINFGSAISNFQAANIGERIQIAEFKNILLDE